MKFFKNRAVAWVVLVVAIVGSCLLGMSKKPAVVPKVEYYNWISDGAKMLSDATEKTIEQYNAAWDKQYRAVIAVASVDSIRGWTYEKFCAQLGGDWGMGPNDMLLLLVKNSDYYVACGDNVLAAMTDTQQAKLQSAIEPYYYKNDMDGAVTAFFRQADVVYGQMNSSNISMYNAGGESWPEKNYSSGINIGGVLLLIIAIFVVWMLLDKIRYNRYQRRSANTTYVVGAPRTVYYPVFWGRQRATPPPPPRPYQAPHHSAPYQAPRQNVTTYRPATPPRQTTSRPTAPRSGGSNMSSRPAGNSRPSGGSSSGTGFSGRGFGGGKHR